MKRPERDELITIILEALDERIVSDSTSQFLTAAHVADVVASRYKIKRRRATTSG